MKLLLSLSIFCVGLLSLVLPVSAQDYGLETTAGAAGLAKYEKNVPTLIGNVIGTALSMIAVIFFILMVYGGFLWMTAHGKEEQVTKAKDTVIAAVIGIIIVLGSYAVTNFVFESVQSGGGPGAPGGGAAACPAGSAPSCAAPHTVGSACQPVAGGAGTCKLIVGACACQ
ncbi:MAG: hypothetical protein A3J66_01640 [Candidatus Magasanikbacteria bacterium RIFCSPHIGHO2_02_FULL_47_14]|uniref:Uncharacterized protein n=1 Tax=Candidatus Magasanikbacteria bacterium RIFCSPHIGHO2_02_FULL_47_14 TaxID=1798680 RepID=A0A1F6LYT2_9BACT|nr:MAG: hypothetical protein A3J66_01640 [Candidatus Magasanikbacteria bacterium RIFCSPHIGHO2_02_FULL_47_14]